MEDIHFILCDPKEDLTNEWITSINKYVPKSLVKNFTVMNGVLGEYRGKFDCIVSPANSYSRIDGSFDNVIAMMFCPSNPEVVTTIAQKFCYHHYNGYMPPGTALVVPMHPFREKKFECKYLLLTPTMRMPSNVRWNKEVCYNGMFSLLNAIKNHNNQNQEKIKSVFLTGLGTGIGRVPSEICAAQMLLAYKHFFINLNKQTASVPTTSWSQATDFSLEIDETNRVLSAFN
jgi:O-acetyl-ADP-ribose deacetylase (regulator of RNase III)